MRISTCFSQAALLWIFSIVSLGDRTLASQAPAPAGQQDFGRVEIKTTKLTDNLYALEGEGGRIGVHVGPDGVFMVDSQFAPLTEKIVAAIRQISDGRIRFLVNTHVHPDHSGGNENFGKMGVTIIGRPQLRSRLAEPVPATASNAGRPASPPAVLPVVTFDQGMTLHMNGEEIELFALPQAHTDGDTGVHFRALDVIMTGDVFRSFGYPNIDRANGGTLKGILEALDTLIKLAGPNTKIVPGHGPIVDRQAVIAHRDMIVVVRDRIAKMIQEGKTVEQVVAAKPTTDYNERTGNVAVSADRFVGQVYAELSGAR